MTQSMALGVTHKKARFCENRAATPTDMGK